MRTSYSKKHKAGISVLSGLTAALLLLTACSKSEETVYQIPEDRKLIVYTAHKADVYEPIIKEFEERTGIFVELKAGDTLALFDELQQDAPGTFDVMFGGGVENFEECRDYLEPYKVSEIDQIAEQYRTEGDAYTPFSVRRRYLSITINWSIRSGSQNLGGITDRSLEGKDRVRRSHEIRQ